ncbi:MAG: hypothetical protein HYY37_03370 [Candidatus Aenigmarchaeota archaeon]|nr:hypothetical protein [Candidatus Aenigmarchaeota archaeon]
MNDFGFYPSDGKVKRQSHGMELAPSIALSLPIIFLAVFSSLAFAIPPGLTVYHGANETVGGIFPDNYTFNGTVNITSPYPGAVPLAIIANTSQTANLTEWRNYTGSILASINTTGGFRFNRLTSCNTIDTDDVGNLICGDDTGGGSGWSNYTSLSYNHTPHVNFSIGSNISLAKLFVNTTVASTSGILVRGVSGQAANLIAWQTDSGGALGSADAGGNLNVTGTIWSMGANISAVNASLNYVWTGTDWVGMRSTAAGIVQLDVTSLVAANVSCTDCIVPSMLGDSWPLDADLSITGGNVGIGTITPFRRLQVNGSAGVSLETNESAYLAIGESQKVGIGLNMTSPLGTVHINSSNALGALRIENTTGAQLLFVNGSSGNVSIGTTSPGFALTMGTNADSTTHKQLAMLAYDSTGGYPNIILNNPGSAFMGIGINGNDLELGTTNGAGTAWATKMVTLQQSSGNVGINTTAPGAKLEIASNSETQRALVINMTNPLTANTQYNGVAMLINQLGGVSLHQYSGALTINNSGNTRRALTIFSNAGSSADTEMVNLYADNTGFRTPILVLNQSGNGNILELANGTNTRMAVMANGNVGIGTTGPGALLSIEEDTAAVPMLTYKQAVSGSGTAIALNSAKGAISNIADDNTATLRASSQGAVQLVVLNIGVSPSSTAHGFAIVECRPGSEPSGNIVTSAASSVTFAFTTSDVTGTTGVDGQVTISCQSDGTVEVENRSGGLLDVIYEWNSAF